MVDSVDAVEYNFSIWNNADYQKSWSLVDKITGNPLDLTDCTVIIELKDQQQVGAPDILKLETVEDPDVTGIYWLDGEFEEFQVTMRLDDVKDLIPAGSKKRSLYYDLLITYPDTYVLKYCYGKVTVTMGSGDNA